MADLLIEGVPEAAAAALEAHAARLGLPLTMRLRRCSPRSTAPAQRH